MLHSLNAFWLRLIEFTCRESIYAPWWELLVMLQCLLSYPKARNVTVEKRSERKFGLLFVWDLFKILALWLALVVGFCPTSLIPYFPLSPYLPTSGWGFFSCLAFQAALQFLSLSYALVCSPVETFTLCWDTFLRSGTLSLFVSLPVSTEMMLFPLWWLTVGNPLLKITVAACGHQFPSPLQNGETLLLTTVTTICSLVIWL